MTIAFEAMLKTKLIEKLYFAHLNNDSKTFDETMEVVRLTLLNKNHLRKLYFITIYKIKLNNFCYKL